MKTKTKNSHIVFKFWKDNKISGYFELTDTELIAEFEKWLPTKERSWLEYYNTSQVVQVFIHEALTAIGNTDNDFEEYAVMEKILKPIKRKYLDGKQIQA